MRIIQRVSGIVVLAVAAATVIVHAQAPGPPPPTPPPGPARDAVAKTGTAVVRGRVVAADTGTPLRRAQVRLNLPTGSLDAPLVLTDGEGRFQFDEMAPGRYTLAASKAGFVSLQDGQRRPNEAGRPIDLVNGQTIDNIDLALPKGGVIVVRLTDAFGAPMNEVGVQAAVSLFSDGDRRLQLAGSGGSRTDAGGESRIFGLMPGEYYLLAGSSPVGQAITPADGARWYVPTYYPGTTSLSEAQRVTVSIGQETSVTFPMIAMKLSRVSGVIRTSDGKPPNQPELGLNSSFLGGYGSRPVPYQPDGSFAFTNMLPGEYFLVVNPSPTTAASTKEYTSTRITLTGEDLTGLVVTTGKGGTLRGRFVFDTGTPPRDVQPGSVTLYPTYIPRRMTSSGRPTWSGDWTFEIPGLFDSPFFTVRVPGNTWFLKAIMVDGRDLSDVPISFEGDRELNNVQVILTQKRGEIGGAVTDATGQTISDYAVIVFAEDRQRWTPFSRYVTAGRPDQQGRFKVGGLPPGNYLVAAVEYLETGAEHDPELLNRLRNNAVPIAVEEGESKTLTLRVTPY